MERGDVKQSLCGSGNINGPCLDPKTLVPRVETLAPPGTAKRIFRNSALAQYLLGQLKFSPSKLWRQAFPTLHGVAVNTPTEEATAFVDAVTNSFFERIKPHVTGKLVIVIDSDRSALLHGQSKPDPSRVRFIQLARAAGASVNDTEPLFQAHFNRSVLKLDVGPSDGHLNALGINLIVQAAANALTQP